MTDVIGPIPDQKAVMNGSFITVWYGWLTQAWRILFAVQQSGATADRPTTNLWIGRTYFDTTLGIPIWIQSVNPTVWCDATGASV